MTRRLVAGQPGAAGGIGVAVVASADGSIDWTSPTGPTADGSVRAIGSETYIRTAAELNSLAVGGLITFAGQVTLTGYFTLDPGNHILLTVTGSLSGTHANSTGVTGEFDGALVEGTVIQDVRIENTSAGLSACDIHATDLSGKLGQLSRVIVAGTRAGVINNIAGAFESVDVIALGQAGFAVRDLMAPRFVAPGSLSVPPNYTAYTFESSAVMTVGVNVAVGANVLVDVSDRFLSFDDGITLGSSAIRIIGNIAAGDGRLLDESPGHIDARDVRMVIKAGSESPEFSVLAQAVFSDEITPILYTPPSADLADFHPIPIQNVGPATVIALTADSHRVALNIDDPSNWWIEILGPIDDLLILLGQAISVTKTGTTRKAHFMWFLQTQGLGPFVPLDVTRLSHEVSTTEQQPFFSEAVFLDSGDLIQMRVSSESTDAITFSRLTFSALAGG